MAKAGAEDVTMKVTFADPRLPARFWAKVNQNGPVPAHRPDLGPCWQWTAALDREGYGRFHWLGQNGLAHRIAYEMLIGPMPAGLEPDHLCRNRACVNPLHIEPVTHRENTLRGNSPVAINARRRQ